MLVITVFYPFKDKFLCVTLLNNPIFLSPRKKKTLENNVGEGENAGYSNVFCSFKFLHLSLCTVVVSKWFKFGEI